MAKQDTTFKPGVPRPAKAGRKKGTPNKTTASLKAAIEQSFSEVGGVKYLKKISKSDPSTYCTLLGKILPKEIKIDLNANIAALGEDQKLLLAAQWAEQLGIK